MFVFVIKKERGIPMVFKERLKEKRTEANLTQVELAEKAGVTAVSYTHLRAHETR